MKILYINRPNFDYLQDFVYTGLVKLLGAENIIEAPWNVRFHLNHRPYPKNLGLSRGNFIASLKAQLRKDEYDAVVVASCHPETIGHYESMMEGIPPDVPRVFIDGGDWPEIAGDLDRIGGREGYDRVFARRPFDAIFKREYLLDKRYPGNVHPLPLCFNYDHLPPLDGRFKYDVAFWAVESDPIRTRALGLLEEKFDCAQNGTVKNQVMKRYKRKGAFYLQELARCKIGLNFRGAGWDTLRFWELAGLGRFMISQKPQILIENDFTHEKNIVYCKDDLSDLIDLCEYYLQHEREREEIAKNAMAHIKAHHTDVSRAQKVLQVIAEL